MVTMRKLALLVLALLGPSLAAAQTTAAPPIDFSGVLFLNFQMRTDSVAKVPTGGKSPNKFDVERVYLIFRMPVGERGSMRVTTDVFQTNTGGYYTGWTARLKHAYFQYDLSKNFLGVDGLGAVGRFGMLHTIVADYVESFWPRWLTNSAMEKNGFFSTADVGVATFLTLPKKRGEVYATITNGSNYTSGETDRFKDVAARFSFTPFGADSGWLRTFSITPWYYKGASQSAFAAPPNNISEGLQKDRRGIFLGLKDRRLIAGAEYSQRIEELESGPPPTRTLRARTSPVTSLFTVFRPVELMDAAKRSKLSLVGRIDNFKLDKDFPASPTNAATRLIIVGGTWDLTSRASFSLDYQGLSPQGGSTVAKQQTWFMHWIANF
jgi:hypothetical protein